MALQRKAFLNRFTRHLLEFCGRQRQCDARLDKPNGVTLHLVAPKLRLRPHDQGRSQWSVRRR